MQVRSKSNRRPGFTLTEVMISLALSLVLILAVSVIFTSAAKTVGSGFALGDAVRAQRSIGQQLRLDVEGHAPTAASPTPGIVDMSDPTSTQAPFLVISGSRVTAFASKADQDSDVNGIVTSYDADGTGDTYLVRPAIYGRRSYRTDQLTFFSEGSFARQTGNIGNFIGAVNGITLAMVTWGHVTLPDNTTPTPNYRAPGFGTTTTNPNQFFADQFTLGRNGVLLAVPVDDDSDNTTPERIIGSDNSRQAAYVWPRNGDADPTDPENTSAPATDNLSPLVWDSRDWTYTSPNATKYLQSSRYDLAELAPGSSDLVAYRDRVQAKANVDAIWWTRLMGIPALGGNPAHRYEASIFAGANPTSATVAKTTPVIARGCIQFIVEFAGDFVTQNPDGTVSTATPDPTGILDYYEDNAGVRGIRWYGLPRDIDGDGVAVGGSAPVAVRAASPDVMPVRDFSGTVQLFERNVNTTLPVRANYADLVAGMGANNTYVCVWALDNADPLLSSIATPPKLIRVTVQLADENGRLADGFSQEYVFRVP